MGNAVAGHYDPGAQGGGLREADIALQWALTIKYVFRRAGLPIFLTREDDHHPCPVGVRNELAERAGCTHYIAIHCNSGGGSGTECYYRSARAWASDVLTVALNAMQLSNRGIHREGQSQHPHLAVMDFKGAACLLELGFIDRRADRTALTSRRARIDFAESLRDLIQSMV